MYESRRHYFIFTILLLTLSLLPGCKKSTTLENGQALTKLTGEAGSVADYSVKLPAGTSVLMIQSSANDQITLQLLNAEKAPVAGCYQATFCTLFSPAAGDYFVHLEGIGHYDQVSLVASWSGNDLATLKNGQPVTGLAGNTGTVILQSLHIPFFIGNLELSATLTGNVKLELLTPDGNVIGTCENPIDCKINQAFSGDYFVRITGLSDFDNLNLLASWGGVGNATLSNGVAKAELAGSAGSEHTESVYLPEGTQGLMVQPSRRNLPVAITLLDEYGNQEGYCTESCVLSNPTPGQHYIHLQYFEDTPDFNLTALWGDGTTGLLKNSVPLKGLSGTINDVLVTSLAIENNTEALLFQSSIQNSISLQLIDFLGNEVWSNNYYGNQPLHYPAPGLYFVRIQPLDTIANFSVTAAWTHNQQGKQLNSVLLNGLNGKRDETLLTSLYIPESTDALLLQPTVPYGTFIELINDQGAVVWNNNFYPERAVQYPAPGAYFVRTYFYEDINDFGITAAWTNQQQGVLQNSVTQKGLSGKRDNLLLASLYIPENTGALLLQPTVPYGTFIELINDQGAVVWSNNYNPERAVLYPAPGAYFVRTYFYEDITEFGITAAWSSNQQGVLQNSVTLKGLSGKRDNLLLTSLYIPENTNALLLQPTLPYGTTIDLINEQGTIVWSNNYNPERPLLFPAPGAYFVRTYFFEDVTEFGITAAWSSNQQGVLQNSVTLKGLSGKRDNLLLTSLYIPENTNALLLQPTLPYGTTIDLINEQGTIVWSNNYNPERPLLYPAPGAYFVRTYFYEDINDFGITAAWSSNQQGTLLNGIPSAPQSGVQYDSSLFTVYVPENTQALMLKPSFAYDINLELLNQNGEIVWESPSYYGGQTLRFPAPGVYFVLATIKAESANFNVTAAWIADGQTELQSGVPLTGLTGDAGEVRVTTLRIPEGTPSITLQTDVDADVALHMVHENDIYNYDLSGFAGTPVQYPEPGYYFVWMYLNQDDSQFNLSGSW